MGSFSGYRSLSFKAVAASAAVLSTAVTIHFAGPSIAQFASSEVPKIYRSLVSWLKPPYLYFVVNGIIISIAASSRFQTSAGSGSSPTAKQEFVSVPSPPPPVVVEETVEVEDVVPAEYGTAEGGEKVEEEEEREEEFVISRSSWEPKKKKENAVTDAVAETVTVTENQMEYSFLNEKPLVSARLGRRRSLKASPEAGKALGVSRPKKHETLESTWKAITEGRNVPLTRHLKKSDTWETRVARDEPSPEPTMRKSETFNEHGGGERRQLTPCPLGSSAAAGRVRKEPSLGQDELNRKVEAFIKKFNEEMRLQRQESFQQYLEMMNHGAR